MTRDALEPVMLENVRLIFRNFAGKEGMYNREGDRNFAVLLTDEMAQGLSKDGWNVKELKAREEEDVPQPYLQVSVNFKGKPPRIVMITSRGRTPVDEDTIELLDWAEIRIADVILNPYNWAVNGKTGIKAYLKTLFVTIEEDDLERKYAHVDDSGPRNEHG